MESREIVHKIRSQKGSSRGMPANIRYFKRQGDDNISPQPLPWGRVKWTLVSHIPLTMSVAEVVTPPGALTIPILHSGSWRICCRSVPPCPRRLSYKAFDGLASWWVWSVGRTSRVAKGTVRERLEYEFLITSLFWCQHLARVGSLPGDTSSVYVGMGLATLLGASSHGAPRTVFPPLQLQGWG